MKIERNVVHRRDAENTEMRYLFSLPLTPVKLAIAFNGAGTPAKKDAHALHSGLEAGQGLTEGKNSGGALGLSFFCPLPAIASSGEAGGSQQKREKCFPLRSVRL